MSLSITLKMAARLIVVGSLALYLTSCASPVKTAGKAAVTGVKTSAKVSAKGAEIVGRAISGPADKKPSAKK